MPSTFHFIRKIFTVSFISSVLVLAARGASADGYTSVPFVRRLMHTTSACGLYNGDFETTVRTKKGILPRGWSIHRERQGHFAIDRTVVHTGAVSVRLSGTTGDRTGVPSFYITHYPVSPGTVFAARVWVRGFNATGKTRIALAWFDLRHFLGQVESSVIRNGTTAWTRLQVIGVTPPETVAIQLHLKSSYNRGTVWFDDASLCWRISGK